MTPDELRGHEFLPDDVMLPRLYETESVSLADKVIHLHYFCGPCDWFIAELGEDRRIAFGYANLGDPISAEWGYIDLNELRDLFVRPQSLGGNMITPPAYVERDLHWTPKAFSSVV